MNDNVDEVDHKLYLLTNDCHFMEINCRSAQDNVALDN